MGAFRNATRQEVRAADRMAYGLEDGLLARIDAGLDLDESLDVLPSSFGDWAYYDAWLKAEESYYCRGCDLCEGYDDYPDDYRGYDPYRPRSKREEIEEAWSIYDEYLRPGAQRWDERYFNDVA